MVFPALVIDASAALCTLLTEDKREEVSEIIRETVVANGQLFVPYFFWDELYNGLLSAIRRDRIESQAAAEAGRLFARLPFVAHDDTEPDIRNRTLSLAERHRLSYYDARYLELSLRFDIRLKTFDRDLLNLQQTYPLIC